MKIVTDLMQHVKGYRHGHGRSIVGAFLAIMGFFWMSKKAGWIPTEMHEASLFWPIIVMVVGIVMVFSRHARIRHADHK